MAQNPKQNIGHDGGARIADMGIIINRGSAHIHAHVVFIDGFERLFAARKRIVKRQLGQCVSHVVFRFLWRAKSTQIVPAGQAFKTISGKT